MSRDEIFKLLLSRATRLGAGSDREEEEEQEEVEQEEVVEDSVEREGMEEAGEGLAERLEEAVGDSLRFWMIFSSMREMTLLLTLCVETEASEQPLTADL